MKTCDDCHTLPECGWCDDGSATGLGKCMEGGDDGPFTKASNASDSQCPGKRWFFIECPGTDICYDFCHVYNYLPVSSEPMVHYRVSRY